MKLTIAAILVACLALSGLAGAVDDVIQGVTATGTVTEELDFTVDESAAGIALTAIYPGPGTATGDADLFATVDWQIAGDVDGKMTDGTNTLAADLVYTIAANSGVAGTFTPVTSYSQSFTSGDYAGTYSATVTWTASQTF